MKPRILLRVAVLFISIHLLGHAMGHSGWDKPEDASMQEVVGAMKGYKAEFMGANRSMGDYYQGYSLMLFGWFLMSATIIWILSNTRDGQQTLARKILLPMGAAYLFLGITEYIYFFPFAAIISTLTGILILVAAQQLRNVN